MFKDVIKILKQHSYIERRQVNAYHEIKASLSENDLMLRVDFGKSFQQDAIQQMASKMPYKVHISEINVLAYFYVKRPNNNNVRNDNVIAVTESSDHDRVASISCQQKVVHKTQHMLAKTYEIVYVWSDGMGLQFSLDLAIYSNY